MLLCQEGLGFAVVVARFAVASCLQQPRVRRCRQFAPTSGISLWYQGTKARRSACRVIKKRRRPPGPKLKEWVVGEVTFGEANHFFYVVLLTPNRVGFVGGRHLKVGGGVLMFCVPQLLDY